MFRFLSQNGHTDQCNCINFMLNFYNITGKSIPFVDVALMNKSASLKINDDLNLSFLPEMNQDWIELFLKFLVF